MIRKLTVSLFIIIGLLVSNLEFFTANTYALDCIADKFAPGCPCAINPNAAVCESPRDLTETINIIVNFLFYGIGIVCIILIIIGGFRYIMSRGESKNVEAAKKTIIGAVIGLVIVILARTIVWFVIDYIT